MPIPDFDHNNVLPPHLGNPTKGSEVSPYYTNTVELCMRFAVSQKRKEILIGLVNFRKKLNQFGIVNGFQWLDGSFLEDIEKAEKRDPNDLDLVTFYALNGEVNIKDIEDNFKEFYIPDLSKESFYLDHYGVDLLHHPLNTVEYVRYWAQLFSHNRKKVWKGMLRLELNTPDIDQEALNYLNSLRNE